jgi:hypothetical protein
MQRCLKRYLKDFDPAEALQRGVLPLAPPIPLEQPPFIFEPPHGHEGQV